MVQDILLIPELNGFSNKLVYVNFLIVAMEIGKRTRRFI
jgi:hypothetical protein